MQTSSRRNSKIDSFEKMLLMSATAIDGTAQDDVLLGTNGDAFINGLAGNDLLLAGYGRNVVDGGDGHDLLVVNEGELSDFDITHNHDGSITLRGTGESFLADVETTVFNVEQIQFTDQKVDTSRLVPEQSSPAESTQAEVVAEPEPEPVPPGASNETPVEEPVPSSVENAPEEWAPALESDTPPEPAPAPAEVAEPFAEETSEEPAEPSAVEPDAPLSSNDEFLDRVIELTNEVRAENGLDALTANAELQATAQLQSVNMAELDFFSHTGQDGLMPWERAESQGYNYLTLGENIAAGQQTPEQVVQAWVNSPSHLANILNPAFKEIGIGYKYLAHDTGRINYNHYWAQVFGTEFSEPSL